MASQILESVTNDITKARKESAKAKVKKLIEDLDKANFFFQGYSLRAISYKPGDHRWSEKIHMIKGHEKWLVGRVPRHWFTTPQGLDLSDHIKNGVQVIYKGSVDERDPLDQLMQRYPKKAKKPVMPLVGNRTLREVVVDQLKSLK